MQAIRRKQRGLALLAATAVLLGPAMGSAEDRPSLSDVRGCPDGGRCSPPRPEPHDGGGSDVGVIIGGGAAAALIIGLIATHHQTQHPKAPPWDSEETLDRDGPQLDEMVHAGEFEVEGYLRNGWPMVFDVDAEPDAVIVLQLDVAGVDPSRLPRYRLVPAPPESGDAAAHGWYARVDLPQIPELADTRRAKLRLTAVKGGKMTPLAVYGVGCGPEAVGSVAVTVDYFGPSPVPRSGEHNADFQVSFHNQALFPQLTAQVTQQRAVQEGGFQRTTVDRFDLLALRQPVLAPSVKGAWPRRGGQFPGAGAYDLDVVAYLPHGPWVMGFAPTPVEVK